MREKFLLIYCRDFEYTFLLQQKIQWSPCCVGRKYIASIQKRLEESVLLPEVSNLEEVGQANMDI
jgi:hypothetical protein